VARKRAGGSLRQRPSGNGGSGSRRRGRSRGGADIDALAKNVVESVQALAAAVSAQGTEVADLRRRIDDARKALR
jgi:molybdenum-dependent DNA-binding transcriptional regulator ModE